MVKKYIQKYCLLLFIVLTLISSTTYSAQNVGDFRSKGDGLWSSNSTWERYTGSTWVDATSGQFPNETNSAWIQVQHTVTVNSNQKVLNLHLSAGVDSNGGGCDAGVCSSFLILGSNSLEIYGFLRNYYASEGTTPALGNNDFNSSIGVSQSQIESDNSGGIIVKGTSRTFVHEGAWAANHNSFRIVFDVGNEDIITIANTFKARRIAISNGTVNSSTNRLSADGGGVSGSSGVFTIEDGGKLISNRTGASSGLQVISKGSDSACQEFRIEEGGTLELLGTNPYIAAANIHNEGCVIYSRSGNQTLLQSNSGGIDIETYEILKLAGTGVKTLANAITVNDSLVIEESAITNRNSFTLSFPSTFSLVFRGDVAQTTTEENWPDLSIPNLIIDNSNGLTLHESKTVTNQLILIQGNIISESHLLTIDADGTIDGGSEDSFVSGPLAHSGNGEKYFPIGKSEIFRPAYADIAGSGHTYSIELIDSEPIGNPVEPIIVLSDLYHWQLESVAGSLSSGSIRFIYDPDDIASDDEDIRIGFSSTVSGDLEELSTLDNSEIGEITVSANPTGVYGLGTIIPQSTLPLVWKSFKIESQNQSVLVNWETRFEKNVSHFEVLKSEDGGRIFKKIGRVNAIGNSKAISHYTFTDSQISNSRNYYKIRQVDIDGSVSTSEIQRIDLGIVTAPKIWVTPSKNLFIESLDSKSSVRVQIFSSTGKVVFTTNLNSPNKRDKYYQIPLNTLKGGIYWVILNKNSQTLKQKIWLAY
ncbi:T9SS type A sorting domain-containing protein [Fulvivirgaceae bacterium LMO-SS25]